MYGSSYADDGVDDHDKAKPISAASDIGTALATCESLTLINYDAPVEESLWKTLIQNTGPQLSKIVVLSKMGVTRAKGGFFGGVDKKLLDAEMCIRTTCAEKNLPLTIVRAGILKGGGPGKDGNDLGMDKVYYNTLFDIVEASVSMAHDKFTVGAEVEQGDAIDLPNAISQMATKSSFEPRRGETNRIVAAGATVAALLQDKPMEISVSSTKSEQLPTMKEWNQMLSTMQTCVLAGEPSTVNYDLVFCKACLPNSLIRAVFNGNPRKLLPKQHVRREGSKSESICAITESVGIT